MLALELGMTKAELRRRISCAEFTEWVAFFNERSRREKAAMKAAANQHR